MRKVVRVSPLKLPKDAKNFRQPIRPLSECSEDYLQNFDKDTLAYDVFERDGRVWLVGPSTYNLKPVFKHNFNSFNRFLGKSYFREFSKSYEAWTKQGISEGSLTFSYEKDFLYTKIAPSSEGLNLFEGKKVLFAISKNNQLNWIRDWAYFYIKNHQINAILLYDNGSTAYELDDILDALDFPELETVIVVDWPFKYGNVKKKANERWDSNFCQRSMFVHARRRFLDRAIGVINQDIDELIITADGRSVFDYLDESANGFIQYSGRWIEDRILTPFEEGQKATFVNFGYFNPTSYKTHNKWVIDPTRNLQAKNWSVHKVVNLPRKNNHLIHFLHFRPISTGWKAKRYEDIEGMDKSLLQLDEKWLQVIEKTWGMGHNN